MGRRKPSKDAARVLLLAALLLAPQGAFAEDILKLPVPAAVLYPGDVISEEALTERAFIAHTVARGTVFEGRGEAVGKVAKRTLLPGQPIAIGAVRDPYVIVQGKAVLLVYQAAGLTITSNAMALQNGGAGDVISVRNIDSGVTLNGTVDADGSVRVGD